MSQDDRHPPGEYERLVASAQLTRIVLADVDYSISPAYYSAQKRLPLDVRSEVAQFSRDGSACLAMISWTFSGGVEGGEPGGLRLESRWVVQCEGIPGGSSDEVVFDFVQSAGGFASYAYARSTLASLVSASAIEIPPAPLIRSRTIPRESLAEYQRRQGETATLP